MLSSVAITAHSPILLNTADAQTNQYKQTTFAAVADLIKQHHVRQIVSISAHPAFARNGFSAYVEKELHLKFPEFGDLVTHESLQPAWSLYHFVREQGLPIEPLNASALDYGHGLPLLSLQSYLDNPLQVLCINDFPAAPDQQKTAFGKQLGALLRAYAHPTMVLCSGDLCLPAQKNQEQTCLAFNEEYIAYIRQVFSAGQEAKAVPPQLIAPCLHGPLQIVRGILADAPSLSYQEVSSAQRPPVSLFSATIQC